MKKENDKILALFIKSTFFFKDIYIHSGCLLGITV